MRVTGLTILAAFNTIMSVLILVLMYGLFRLNFGLIEGASDNAGLLTFLFIGLVIMGVLWLAFYQLSKHNKRVWLLLYLVIGIVLTVLNIQFMWFLFLMLIYFAGIGLIFFDKDLAKEVKDDN